MAFLSYPFLTPVDGGFYPGVFPQPRLVELHISGGPVGCKALFVSDVHLRRSVSEARLEALMSLMAGAKADLLLLSGDYAEKTDQFVRFFEALGHLSFPLGGFAVLGNNDRGNLEYLRNTVRAAGVTLLINEAQTLSLSEYRLQIAGCDEYHHGSPQTRSLFSPEVDYRILLSHYPILPECKCDLMLSGHTHGGQCNLWGITPYSLGFEHKYHLAAIRGHRRIDEMDLWVGNGIGVSRFPFRLGAEPQIYLLKFGK